MNKIKHPPAVTPRDESRPFKPRLRWKKDEALTGLARIAAGPRGSRLHDGVHSYASVYADKKLGRPVAGWYWVARNDEAGVPLKNTCNATYKTEDEAKAAAMEYVKACLAGKAAA